MEFPQGNRTLQVCGDEPAAKEGHTVARIPRLPKSTQIKFDNKDYVKSYIICAYVQLIVGITKLWSVTAPPLGQRWVIVLTRV